MVTESHRTATPARLPRAHLRCRLTATYAGSSTAHGRQRPASRITPDRRARRTAARTGGNVPAEWGPVIAQAADFEPESDGHLLDWMAGQVTGMAAYAEALIDAYETGTGAVGIDPRAWPRCTTSPTPPRTPPKPCPAPGTSSPTTTSCPASSPPTAA